MPAPAPHQVLFPLAVLHGAIAVPLWLLAAAHLPPAWHAHEMLFGYAPAVLAGFLVTRRGPYTWMLAAAWLVARAAPFLPNPAIQALAGLAFPALLFALATPPLWRGAKRPQNYLLPAIVLVLLLLNAAWWWAGLNDAPLWQRRVTLATIDLYALLLALVGGRALPAAIGGFLERQGLRRRDHRRREWELPLAAVLGAALMLDLLGLYPGAGAMALIGAAALSARVLPWQLGRIAGAPALWAPTLGYLWLIPGLALKGAGQLQWLALGSAAVHGVTIGALGILTVAMMARTTAARANRPLAPFARVGAAAALMSTAVVLRLLAAGREPWLLAAATAWSLALVTVLPMLVARGGRGS